MQCLITVMFSNHFRQVYLSQAISSLIKQSNSGLDAYVVRNTTLAWTDGMPLNTLDSSLRVSVENKTPI